MDESGDRSRLNSWKAIAAYLNRTVRTVQRWEKSAGLPINRQAHDKPGTIYAYTSELDNWWKERRLMRRSLLLLLIVA